MQVLRHLHEILFPSRCLGCGRLDEVICQSCTLQIPIRVYRKQLGSIPVYSSISYNSKASRILLAAKEDGIKSASKLLEGALAHALRIAVRDLAIRPILVPVPHSSGALRKRGRNFVSDMSVRIALQESLPVREILCHNRRVQDQAGLDARTRFGNLQGAMNVFKESGRSYEVILVDDLMTTGATLTEAVRALEQSGFRVIAAITALVALPLR